MWWKFNGNHWLLAILQLSKGIRQNRSLDTNKSRSIWHILSKYHLCIKNHGPSLCGGLWQKCTSDSKFFLWVLTSTKELSSASLSTFFTKRSSSYGFPGTESWLLNLRMTLASTLISIRFWSSTYLIGFIMWIFAGLIECLVPGNTITLFLEIIT